MQTAVYNITQLQTGYEIWFFDIDMVPLERQGWNYHFPGPLHNCMANCIRDFMQLRSLEGILVKCLVMGATPRRKKSNNAKVTTCQEHVTTIIIEKSGTIICRY